MLRFLTGGESHGKCLVGILDGLPAGLKISHELINNELARRQKGFGRGGRMALEHDLVEILSGLHKGKTIGSPLTLLIKNKDAKIDILPAVTCARPGHADIAGALKFNTKDIRDVLERASARETAMRVAIGAVCKILLKEMAIEAFSHVLSIGRVCANTEGFSIAKIKSRVARSQVNCADSYVEKEMIAEIKRAKNDGDTLGGVFEVIADKLPVGLGSCAHWERRLDTQAAAALMSIPAIKAVEIGEGFLSAFQKGSDVHDPLYYSKAKKFYRTSNRAGGLEGGMTNGEPLVLRCAMKPIATLMKPLDSVHIKSKKKAKASVERADVCAVPAASVVGESVIAFILAKATLEKFAGDSLVELMRNFRAYLKQTQGF